MGTVIHVPSVDKLLEIAAAMHKTVLAECTRVNTHIKIDDRKDKNLDIDGKIAAV